MAWWQKKLLRYALSYTGLLDDQALHPDNLDITLGTKNVIELKNVALNIKRISKLAQLPPDLRVETARVLSLRLTVPADIYHSSIVIDADGVELSLKLEEKDRNEPGESKRRDRSPVTTRSPLHRKVPTRLHSPPPYDPGGPMVSEEGHIPTTEELAKSFLMDEAVQDRRELEAFIAPNANRLEESVASATSDGDDVGTGAVMALPNFLAGFLQGIVDRLVVHISNLEASVRIDVPGEDRKPLPVMLKLRVDGIKLPSSGSDSVNPDTTPKSQNTRPLRLHGLSLDLVSDVAIWSEFSKLPSNTSPAQSKMSSQDPQASESSKDSSGMLSLERQTASLTHRSTVSDGSPEPIQSPSDTPNPMIASTFTADSDRFADAGEEDGGRDMSPEPSDYGIEPGDDNISWGSRRSNSTAPAEDLWNSMVSEDDLPDSLLLERTSTPRAHSSRSGSFAVREKTRDTRRNTGSFQSLGSRPKLEQIPPHQGLQQTPLEPQAEVPVVIRERTTDNKRSALESSAAHHDSATSPDPLAASAEDMEVSRIFTHKEAESMYMSAMTQNTDVHMPGGWSSSEPDETPSPPRQLKSRQSSLSLKDPAIAASAEHQQQTEALSSASSHPPSRNLTPRPNPEEPSSPQKSDTKEAFESSEQLVSIDSISVWIPTGTASLDVQEPNIASSTIRSVHSPPHNIPGAFSAYSDLAASRRRPTGMSEEESHTGTFASSTSRPVPQKVSRLEMDVGSIKSQVNIVTLKVLCRLLVSVSTVFSMSDRKKSESDPTSMSESSSNHVFLAIQEIQLSLKANAEKQLNAEASKAPPLEHLITIKCRNISLDSLPDEIDLRLGLFEVLLGKCQFLSFDRDARMQTSMTVTSQTPDIALTVSRSKRTIQKLPVTEINVETLPIDLLLDISTIDTAFSSFGGFSSMTELGSSVFSESINTGSQASSLKNTKGVRFEGETQLIGTKAEVKGNGRIGGLAITVQTEAFSVLLRSTTVRAIYREQGAVATVEQISLSGPHQPNCSSAPLSIDLSTLRLEYFTSPQDKDLERLLSLLTPSKDKYDSDDDILIDTLLRQRRKGSLARLSTTDIRLKCENLECLATLSSFADEVGKLSAVAKYLPEDERPGLLVLLRVKEFEARVPVNEQFRLFHLNLTDFHCAYVGLPALLALSIGNVKASQNGELELVHSFLQLKAPENLPMVMARMLGDEIEPTLKVKLYNLCVEYTVSTLVALTGLEKDVDVEELVTELAKSVQPLIFFHDKDRAQSTATATQSCSNPAKRWNIDLIVHDSAIGLTPQKLKSKGLFVLTRAHFSTLVPPGDTLTATLELHKAALFVADSVLPNGDSTVSARGSPHNSTANAKVILTLAKQGFVSVGSIMSATILLSITDSIEGGSKLIKVDVKNELLLLETCADSTQTLIALFSGLMPPATPSKQPKYLTEPMTIEDMMASFTSDAYSKPEPSPQTIFDVDEYSDDPDLALDLSTFGEDPDELLAESEMTSSLYGPIGGMLEDDQEEDYPETAESLLEDDPFEMTIPPAETKMSDAALIRDLGKQALLATDDEPVELNLYEIKNLGFDATGGNQRVLDPQYRFSTTDSFSRKDNAGAKQLNLPLQLKVRDVHIIWNIYDGYDWERTRDGITHAVEEVETRAEERKARQRRSLNDENDDDSVIGDFLFNSIYIGVPNNHAAQELRRRINENIDELTSDNESGLTSGVSRPTSYSTSGRPLHQRPSRRLKLERSKSHKIAFELKGVSADVLVFPTDNKDVVNSIDVRVENCEIFDNMPTSTWRKFLTNGLNAREMSKPMMHVELFGVKTLENFAASEIVMHVSVLPLRLHVDQDALDFITRFFEFKDNENISSVTEEPFLQRIEIETVDLCLDYKPKKIDYVGLRSGHATEFMNIVALDAANIRLKHAIVYGLNGFGPLHQTLNDIWMPDIKRNQLPVVLAGIAPVRGLVNIGTGIRDVVAIPIREYKKDGRVVRSIQKGAFHFGKTTTSELARLGAKVAIGTQNLLQGAEALLSPAVASPASRLGIGRRNSSEQSSYDLATTDSDHEQRAISAYANQAPGVRAGLRSALKSLNHDLLTARNAVIAVPGEVLASPTPGAAAAAVARHAPTVILRPVIGASKAVGTALLGVGNQIDRENMRRARDKYK